MERERCLSSIALENATKKVQLITTLKAYPLLLLIRKTISAVIFCLLEIENQLRKRSDSWCILRVTSTAFLSGRVLQRPCFQRGDAEKTAHNKKNRLFGLETVHIFS